jgi:hypothetical protein
MAAVAALALLSAGPAQGADTNPPNEPKATQRPITDEVAKVTAVPPATAAALARIQKRIAGYVAVHGTQYTFADYVDPTTGKIVLDTDAPAGLASTLTDLADAPAEQRQAARQAQVRRKTIRNVSSANRRDDTPPFWGGGGISLGAFSWCSSGYPVKNSAGTVFMVTAGHCFNQGATVVTESGMNTYGTVSDQHLPKITGDSKDMELIGGRPYAPNVFTGGVTSGTSIPVFGAGPAVVGYTNYCHSGRTTGEQCGHTVLSINAQSCSETGCVSPLIAYSGGVINSPGDSGAPFYCYTTADTRTTGNCASNAPSGPAGIKIRGHVVQSSKDGTIGYAEPWTEVASTLGVSIVTAP